MMSRSTFSKFKDLFREAANNPAVIPVPTAGESYTERLSFAGHIEQLTSDFLRSRMSFVLNQQSFNTLLIDKFKEYAKANGISPIIFESKDEKSKENPDKLLVMLERLNEKLIEKGLSPINLESPGMTEQTIVAQILKEQLFANCPSFNALDTTQALAQYLHQGNSLFNIRPIVDKQLTPLNCSLSISRSKKAEQLFQRCYFYPHEESTPEHPKFSIKQYCHISTDIIYDGDPVDIRIEASKPHNDLIIGECIQSFELTHHHGEFKVTPTLESLKINSPNTELDAFLNRTSENNAHVTKMFQDYIASNKPEKTQRYRP